MLLLAFQSWERTWLSPWNILLPCFLIILIISHCSHCALWEKEKKRKEKVSSHQLMLNQLKPYAFGLLTIYLKNSISVPHFSHLLHSVLIDKCQLFWRMGYFNNSTLNIPSISGFCSMDHTLRFETEFFKKLFDLLMGTSSKSNALIFRYGWSLWTHYLPVQFYLLSRISYLSFLTSKTKKMKSILFSFSFAWIEDDLYLGWAPNLSFSLHEQKYRLHTRRPNSSAAQSSTNCSQPGPQFVVVGGIWVPPQDYVAAAAAAVSAAQPSADITARSSTIYTPVASVPSPRQQNNKRPLVNGPRCNGNSGVSPKSASPSTSSSSQTTTASPPFWLFSTVCHIYGLVCRFFCYLFFFLGNSANFCSSCE